MHSSQKIFIFKIIYTHISVTILYTVIKKVTKGGIMTAELSIAVHALVFLAHKNEVLSSEKIAENVCTNPARIRKIMSKLVKNGLVDKREGLNGGYSMKTNAEEMKISDVAQAIKFDVVRSAWKTGDTDVECLVSSGMADIMDDVYTALNRICIEKLANITIKDVDNVIFNNYKIELE